MRTIVQKNRSVQAVPFPPFRGIKVIVYVVGWSRFLLRQ
jgi:hypothetical protein